jgi:beta-glucosidase
MTRTRHPARRAALAALVLLALAPATNGAAAGTGTVHPESWPALAPAFAADAALEAFVGGVLEGMSLEEKVGQVIQADIASVTPADVATYHLGSVLAGGNAAPGGDVRAPASAWVALTHQLARAARAGAPPGHTAIPLVFGIDAVHGHARIPGATVFPHNVGLGAAHDPALIEAIGRATALEVAATGIDWTFAPTVAVARDVRWGRAYESYSEDPALVAEYARAMVVGLQGAAGTPGFLGAGHTLATVKHFLGDGGTLGGRDQFDNRADEATLRDVAAAGYPAALAAGALIVMASYNGWQGTKMHANRALLTDVLKDRWHFPGFVVGDWNAQEEIPGCTKYDCPALLAAGVDMYMAPDSWKRLYANLLAEARAGTVDPARLDDAVRRILRVKALAGLFAKPLPADRAVSTPPTVLGNPAHRALARRAVRASLVLLKNEHGLLPLDPHATVLVAGPGADDIGMQSGGWTIDWQGDHNRNADFPGGTSILAGIRAAVEAAGGRVLTRPDDAHPKAAIVVYGERPYAEFEGDREQLEAPGAGATLALLARLRARHIPTVTVLLSGRPLWVNRELNASDAFVAAWLPGSEGAGIADLLFRPADGGAPLPFSGRLAFSWPATARPVTFDAAGEVHGALFARGYGLGLGEARHVARLSEARGSAAADGRDTLFHAGHVTAPWSAYVADATAEVRLTMDAQASPEQAVTTTLDAASILATWSGRAPAAFFVGGRPADYRGAAGRTLVARYRVDVPPAAPVGVGVRCEAPYGTRPPADPTAPPVPWQRCGTPAGAFLDLTATFRAAAPGTWHTLELPLACLARAGARLDTVSAPFVVTTRGPFAVRFREIRLIPARGVRSCPAPLG